MRVLVVGSEGFIGQALVARIAAGATVAGRRCSQLTRLDLAMPPATGATAPPASGAAGANVADGAAAQRCVAGDLADASVLAEAIGDGVDAVFHLASVPGGAAERDFELGMRVNLQGTLALLELLRAQRQRLRLVFASTIAVYGVPMPVAIDERTLPEPALSYGTQKYIGELLVADYSRRGYIDGISVRIPGIVARPAGAGMLSLFLSDLIRELSAGRSVVCPVAADAPSWWMSRPCMVDNLLRAAALDGGSLNARRSYLMPVQRATIAEVVAAIASRCGASVYERISYQPDARLQAQFASYPPMHCPEALAAGFRHDGDLEALVTRALESC